MREKVIQAIEKEKIITIVRGIKSEKLIPLAEAMYDGGIRFRWNDLYAMIIRKSDRSVFDPQTVTQGIACKRIVDPGGKIPVPVTADPAIYTVL